MRPARACLLVLFLIATISCGIVDEDGAYLSENAARELLAGGYELKERGDYLRAAEVFEGLALGFPGQHWSERALRQAAICRWEAGSRANGPARERELERSARLFERLRQRTSDESARRSATRHAGIAWATLGDCARAKPLLESYLSTYLEEGAKPPANLLPHLERCGIATEAAGFSED